MFGFLVWLAIVTLMLWIGFKVTGALFKACLWLFVCVPSALIIWGLAIICICTLILIPVGVKLFATGLKILLPR